MSKFVKVPVIVNVRVDSHGAFLDDELIMKDFSINLDYVVMYRSEKIGEREVTIIRLSNDYDIYVDLSYQLANEFLTGRTIMI